MNRRVLLWVAAVSATLMLVGLGGVDRWLAGWIRSSGIEQSRVFVHGLVAFDTVFGIGLWIWLAGSLALAIGCIGFVWRRESRWPRALITASLVQFASLCTMIVGKNHFGRLRPHEVLASGDWSHVWYAGGSSFPSGHAAFYCGLLVPLAAACPIRWLRALLLAIPLFVVIARMDLAKHFLSDVSSSALFVALYALLAASLMRHWLPSPEPVRR
ncbi:MAG: phosphatase PAP2 family protein [Dokdonella sp.]